ncbi:expressed unknown protein [Seminavis robusta]|uniref:Uncharacterized protein n=1 Tax=Seminavis robusta TaxID=568900 RepID=A0A9N8HA50_9STRA|nr:expressed unknown protein [Seminavis robusta]|eukprot:Sro136_g064170.1 n/a (191) ;mRNA; f:72481-73053
MKKQGIPEFVFVRILAASEQNDDDCFSISSTDSLSSLEGSRFMDSLADDPLQGRVPPRRPARRLGSNVGGDDRGQFVRTSGVRTKTIELRTHSLPMTPSASVGHKHLLGGSSPSSGSKVTTTAPLTFSSPGFFHDSNLSSDTVLDLKDAQEAHVDRAPKVPRRRGSIQTSASCPLFVIRHKATVRGALAA